MKNDESDIWFEKLLKVYPGVNSAGYLSGLFARFFRAIASYAVFTTVSEANAVHFKSFVFSKFYNTTQFALKKWVEYHSPKTAAGLLQRALQNPLTISFSVPQTITLKNQHML